MERTQYVHYVFATEHNPPSRLHSHTLFADSRFQTLQRRETLTPDCKLSFKTKCQGAHIDVLVTHIIQLYNKQTIHKQTHWQPYNLVTQKESQTNLLKRAVRTDRRTWVAQFHFVKFTFITTNSQVNYN